MKRLYKRALAMLLTAVLVFQIGAVPSSAGTAATYPPDGAQFTNADGWVLQGFAVNGASEFSAHAWDGAPSLIHLDTIWRRDSETVEHENGDQVTVATGTFTWEVADESILLLGATGDGTDAMMFGLKEGKTVVTVTGPQGKVSKTGVVVMPDGEDVIATYNNGAEPVHMTDDGWELWVFHPVLNHLWADGPAHRTLGEGETGTMLLESSWWNQNGFLHQEGFINFAVEEFTWSVSDESVAVLRDDYPGVNAMSIEALRPGMVTVYVAGPLGKVASTTVYVMPRDDFGSGPGDPDDPPPGAGPGPGPGPTPGGWTWPTLPPKTALVTAITIQPASMVMYPDEWTLAMAVVLPWNAANPEVTWSSSDTSIATVDAYGFVKAAKPGNATITATAQDGSRKSASSHVTVKPRLVEKITLSANDLTLYEGETEKLSATITPASATDKRVTWSSSDTSIATVDPNGLVTAKQMGTVTITCTAQDASKTKATCTVTVKRRFVESVTLNAHDIEIFVGEQFQLNATVKPDNAKDRTVIYKSENSSAATVSATGLITGRNPGTAVVICTARDGGGASDTCRVVVKPRLVESIELNESEITISVGEVFRLIPTVLPTNATNKSVTYVSDDASIASVVATNGQVVGRAAGTAVVTCTAKDGSGATAVCRVTVVPKATQEELFREISQASPAIDPSVQPVIFVILILAGIAILDKLGLSEGAIVKWFENLFNSFERNGTSLLDSIFSLSSLLSSLFNAKKKYGAAWPYKEVTSNANCYAYVLGYNIHLEPGGKLLDWSVSHSVDEIISLVRQDLGSAVRVLDKYNSPITDAEYRVAVSTRFIPQYDYHFLLQHSDGTWSGKNKGYPSEHFGSLIKNPGASVVWRGITFGPHYLFSTVKYLAIAKALIPTNLKTP